MTTSKRTITLSALLASSALSFACQPKIHIPLVSNPVEKNDLCGSARNCGLDGTPLLVSGETPLLTEGPAAKLGGWLSSSSRKTLVFQVPSPCAVDLTEYDFIDRLAGTASYKFDSAKKTDFTVDVEAKLSEELSKYLDADAKAALDSAKRATQNTELTFDIRVMGVRTTKRTGENMSPWHRVEHGCHAPVASKNAVLPRQVSYLVVSGTSKSDLVRKIKGELAIALKPPEEVKEVVDAQVDVGAQINRKIEKVVDAVISKNAYLLGMSY